MESSKLKNILLIILLVTNLLLLSLVASQRLESRRARQKTLDNAVSLLEEQGISIAPEVLELGDFPPTLPLEQSSAEGSSLAQVLGEDVSVTRRGLATYYVGTLGQGESWDDGAFSIEFAPGAFPLGNKPPEEHALATLEKIGCIGILTGSTGNTLSVTQCRETGREKIPIYSCTVTLTYENGALATIQGRRAPGRLPAQAAGGQEGVPLSLATLLLRFRAGILDRGDACTAITAARQGYALTASGGLYSLTPVLQLTTDTQVYCLDALTGEFLTL